MNRRISFILLPALFLCPIVVAAQDHFIEINGQEIPVFGGSDLYPPEIHYNLSEGMSIASFGFHQKYVIPLQKKLGAVKKPLICLLTDGFRSGLIPVKGPVYLIALEKNSETEGSISSLVHELGHVLINGVKSETIGLMTDLGMINYPLKMKDNFIGFGICGITSAALFYLTSQYYHDAYLAPIAYGIFRIVEDVAKGQYYNYCRRLEEEVCDICIAKTLQENEGRSKYIDQFIASLSHNLNQTYEVRFFMLLTGSTHPSTQSRITELTKMKGMNNEEINKLFQKKFSLLMNRYKRFYSMTVL